MDLLEAVDARDVDTRRETVASCDAQIEELRGRKLTPEEKRKYKDLCKIKIDASGKCPIIDMIKLLACSTSDGMPVWTVMNPYYKISKSNGWFANRQTSFGRAFAVKNNRWYDGSTIIDFGLNSHLSYKRYPHTWYSPEGNFPTLPDRVRELIWSKPFKSAYCVGLVYQPTKWVGNPTHIPAPDPAIVVRWTSTDVWHCAAVWGHDGPRIQEFY